MGEGDQEKFYRIVETKTDGDCRLLKYKSHASGITVCIAETDGPLVAGYLCVATEAHDDDGLPHTLEHLVFMGSEQYPYKGVLDLLANRCLASGTNAWTDTDHTCYTMTTAGYEGFLNLLPIYLDHLLYPTLTESAFVTEVHHINGDGEDAGVVYCEMQARENSGESRCHLAMLRAMYPGDCGYKSETGGLMKNLRESTNNKKIHIYHKEFYRPENLCIIIVGKIDADKVFQSLKPIEEKILSKRAQSPFNRPWQTPVPDLEESVDIIVPYPCDEDKYGIIMVAFRGPAIKDYSDIIAIEILMDYLTDTSVSPLQREFVENEFPFCNKVDYSVIANFISCVSLHFSNVPMEKLSTVKARLFETFKKIADGDESLDMKRMASVIHKRKLSILNQMECYPHDHLAVWLIADFLYGSTVKDLQHFVQQIPVIETLTDKSSSFWVALLKKYLIDGKYVVILGEPSPTLSEQMSNEEKERIAEQKKQLECEGLKQKEEILEKSMAINEIKPPEDTITAVPVPSVESIKFHPIQRSCNYQKDATMAEFPLKNMPCSFQLDVVHSSFVRMFVLMDTSVVPQELRLYLPLFIELLIESPVQKDNELVPHQEIVKQLAADTVSASTSLGLHYSRFCCQKYSQIVSLKLMVEEEKYSKGVQWIRELLFQTVFVPSRIKTIATKMISDVAEMKRSGQSVVRTMMKNLCFTKESSHWATSMLRQYTFLTTVLETLDTHSDKVVDALNQVRSYITNFENMTVHLALNLQNLKQKEVCPETAWQKDFLPSTVKPKITSHSIRQCYELLQKCPGELPIGVIAGVGSVESSYLLQTVSSINSYTHPDYPALLVLIQYLTQLEGPMWRQIRGLGLSYNYSIAIHPNEGLLYFSLFKSTHVVKAYKEGLNIIESHIEKKTKWEPSLLESAYSSLVFEIIEKESTVADIVEHSLCAYYKDIDMNYTKSLLQQISKVTTEDMERVGALYLKPLFDVDLSRCTVCCHPSKVNDVVDGFKEMKRELTVIPSLEDSFMAKF